MTTQAKGRGRPRKEPTSRIMIYLPEDLAAFVREQAEAEGRTLTAYFERLVRQDLAHQGKNA